MPTVKVLSPEMTALERADGIKTPAGNSAPGVMANRLRPPGIEGRFERIAQSGNGALQVANVGPGEVQCLVQFAHLVRHLVSLSTILMAFYRARA